MSNTLLWDSVCKTDPDFTKSFSRSGGFKGTAISPMYLMFRATERFGPVGIGWGFNEIENKYLDGVWFSRVNLWYVFDGVRGEVEQWGATTMLNKRSSGDIFIDEEAAKKAITDAVTKCLSYLGFAADVHMGLFDDSKYVSDLKAEKRKNGAISQDVEPPADMQHDAVELARIKAQKITEAELAGVNTAHYDEPKVKKAGEKPDGGPTLKQVIEAFDAIKVEFQKFGAEQDYYDILAAAGYNNKAECAKAGSAASRKVYIKMAERLKELKRTAEVVA